MSEANIQSSPAPRGRPPKWPASISARNGNKPPAKGSRAASTLTKALVLYGESRYDDIFGGEKSNAQALAEVAWKRAIAGNLDWAEFVTDRILGKAVAPIAFQNGDGGPISVNLISFATPAASPMAPMPPIDVTPEADPLATLL